MNTQTCHKLYINKSLSLIKLTIILCNSIHDMEDCHGEVLTRIINEPCHFNFENLTLKHPRVWKIHYKGDPRGSLGRLRINPNFVWFEITYPPKSHFKVHNTQFTDTIISQSHKYKPTLVWLRYAHIYINKHYKYYH